MGDHEIKESIQSPISNESSIEIGTESENYQPPAAIAESRGK